jgi:hypothetical protein
MLIVATALSICLDPELVRLEGTLVRGVVTGHEVIALGTVPSSDRGPIVPRAGGRSAVLRSPFRTVGLRQADLIPLHLGSLGSGYPTPRIPPLRWKVAGGRCYVAEFPHPIPPHLNRGVVASFPLDAAARFGQPFKGPPLSREEASKARAGWQMAVRRVADLDPFDRAQAEFDGSDARRMFFDFWIGADHRLELYVLGDQGQLSRWDYRPDDPAATNGWIWNEHWWVKWAEPFYVVAGGDRRFFVTESGRVYAAPVGAKPGADLSQIGGDSPLRVLLMDTVTGKAFGFTESHYFEIADRLQPRSHSLKDLRGRTGDEVLDTLLRCASVIRPDPVREIAPPPRVLGKR